MADQLQHMSLALRLARRGYGKTSPNPMVGAVLVKRGRIIGRGWHNRAGAPHAEIEAIRDAQDHGRSARGATLFVTLEPCCTHGRTPPCTEAIIAAGIKEVVVAATDPNPRHRGRAFAILRRAGLRVTTGVLAEEGERLNEAFNHWIVQRTPFVTVKAAMTMDGKIATDRGDSKWITGRRARGYGMKLRQGADAILVGINTVLADDPSLSVRGQKTERQPLRIVLDAMARTPLDAKLVTDRNAHLTRIVVSKLAPKKRVRALAKQVNVLVAPSGRAGRIPWTRKAHPASRLDLPRVLRTFGAQNVVSLLVEGGGEVNASFLLHRLAQRVAFFYAPKVLGGRDAVRAVAGDGASSLADALHLGDAEWRKLGPDLLLSARVVA